MSFRNSLKKHGGYWDRNRLCFFPLDWKNDCDGKEPAVPPSIQLLSDTTLSKYTIQASPETIQELRLLIGDDRYHFEDCCFHADDQVSVSPELYDAFDAFLTSLSGTQRIA